MGIGIVSLSIFAVLLLALVIIPPITADAQITRVTIYELKNTITSLEKEIVTLENEKINHKNTLILLENRLIEEKEAEKIAREWHGYAGSAGSESELKKAQDIIMQTGKEIIDTQTKLNNTINEINTKKATILTLKDKVTSDTNIIKKQDKEYLSTLTKVVGIKLSNNCITMITQGYDTNCPSYEDLAQLDNSDIRSGEFQFIDGFYQRGPALVKNDCRLYDFEKDFTIIVDPSEHCQSRIKTITIENNFDTYFTVSDMVKQNHTRTVNHDRYMDGCKNSTINADKTKSLLPDTIHYLRTDCTITQFESVETITDPITNIDITTSPFYQYTLWLEGAKETCKVKC